MSRRQRTQHLVGFQGMRPDRMGRWRTVMDLDFKSNCWTAGALTENAGSLTVLNGNEYHLYVRNTSDMSWTQTADTGMVVDFSGGHAGKNRLTIKVPYFLRDKDGKFPRIRASASFSGLTVSNNGDYIGVGVTGWYINNANPKNPHPTCIYDVNNKDVPSFKYFGQSIKGTWGQTGSGLETTAGVGSDGNNPNGVLVIEDGGQGVWIARGHDGDVNISTGSAQVDTFRAQVTAASYDGQTTDRPFYRADTSGNYDGPYVSLWCNTGQTGGSQAVTWERLIVEVYY